MFLMDLVNQMSGLFVVMDKNSRFIFANNVAAKWAGFKSSDSMLGKTYCDMLCKASNQHDIFANQDTVTRDRDTHVKIVGYYQYADKWHLVFGEKYPLRDNEGNLMGTVSHFNDVTNCNIIDLSKFLKITQKGGSIKLDREQKGYVIENHYPDITLPGRQSECLFFLLRGKTAKEIGKILGLSYRTVEGHIEQIKCKFDCSSKSELLEKAISYDYMNIIPERLFLSLK